MPQSVCRAVSRLLALGAPALVDGFSMGLRELVINTEVLLSSNGVQAAALLKTCWLNSG